ncbi:substrate-binding domain-containing protein [Eubacterium sp.]|uniref:substrate-binding domain-containing protein n=1 Tax=Eubacterium sp. TaxID=142586 RepID=UPI002FC6A15A
MKKKFLVVMLAVCLALGMSGCVSGERAKKNELAGQSLLIYCGAGMKEPFQKIADAFKEETGCEMNVTFANAAQIQTQINESKEGDFFIAGSGEEVKPVGQYVESSVDLVKHIPVLAVAKGNPKGIIGIGDLGKEGITTVIGDPESTPIGKIAKKAFVDFGVANTVTLVATTTTAPQLATVIAAGEADATIVWKENCNVDSVEICGTTDLDPYTKTIPAARLNFNTDNKAADIFSEFLVSDTVHGIWNAFGYEVLQ